MENVVIGLRLILTIVVVFLLPGGALVLWLFPVATLDAIERLYLSILASIGITSLLTFTLTTRAYTGLDPQQLILVLLIITAICLPGAIIRSRKNLKRPSEFFRGTFIIWFVTGLAALTLAGAMLGTALSAPAPASPLTEFYITPELLHDDGVAYTRIGNDVIVPIAITNKEGKTVIYRIESWLIDQKMNEQDRIVVDDTSTWQGKVSISLVDNPTADYLEIFLFRNQEMLPTAKLRLWLSES